MTPKAFGKNLQTLGYTPLSTGVDLPAWEQTSRSGNQTVHLRNSMGGAYVLHLGHNCLPRAAKGLTGERWFEYVEPKEKGETLQQAWQWFQEVGLAFLSEPHSRPLHEWQTEEEILVRVEGKVIDIPRTRYLP